MRPGDNALVISTGYFGERYKNILATYGANVTVLQAEIGEIVSFDKIEEELSSKNYKLVTITHVDTSTGVLTDPKSVADIAKKYNTLTVLDGVCATAGENTPQEDWGIDVVLTGSQKAIGVPPGLALLVVSEKAMTVWKNRKTPGSKLLWKFYQLAADYGSLRRKTSFILWNTSSKFNTCIRS